MPRKLVKFLEGDNIYSCIQCGAHLSCLSELISKDFQGQSGRAFLFNNVYQYRYTEQMQFMEKRVYIKQLICIVMFVEMMNLLDGNIQWPKVSIKNIRKGNLLLKKHAFRNCHGLLIEEKQKYEQ